MNKNLIALAVSAAFALPAMADVVVGPLAIYGTAASAFENVSIDFLATAPAKSTTNTSKTSQSRLMDQTSKLGFKTSQDLGSGMNGLAQIESRFYLGNGGNNSQDKAELGSRNTFVGLGSSQFGTVRLGRYDNAYKLTLKAAAPFIYNNVNDATGDYGDKQIMTRLGTRQGDIIAYESPKISGFQALISYNMGKDTDNGLGAASFAAGTGATAAAAATKTSAVSTFPATLMPQTSLSLAYADGPITAAFGYTSINNAAWKLDGSSAASDALLYNTTGGASFALSAYQFGGQYTVGEFSFGAMYELTSSSQAGVRADKNFDQTQATYALTGAYKSGPHEAHIRYAAAADVAGNTGTTALITDTGATQYSLMYAYEIQKNVKVIGSYTQVANKTNAAFTSGSGFSVDTGANMRQFAIGLSASF